VVDIIKRNKDALLKQYDLTSAMQISNTLKLLPPGGQFTFPDGTVVHAEDILTRLQPRTVVLLGDTSDASAIAPLAMGANLLVHEATNAWFPLQK
jgi:ribonuclease Z